MQNALISATVLIFLAISTLTAYGQSAACSIKNSSKKERVLMRTGGIVENRDAARGKIVFLDVEGASNGVLDDICAIIDHELRCNTEIIKTNAPFKIESAAIVRTSLSANALIAIVDENSLPITLTAPEARWGLVNISPLRAGKPAKSIFLTRVKQAILRGFGYVCGAANSSMACIMFPAFTATDLDEIRSQNFSPDTIMRIEEHLKGLGISQYQRATYKTAVISGWAPAPTNEYQKAIWEKVHQLPTEPIKIKPETKKVKE